MDSTALLLILIGVSFVCIVGLLIFSYVYSKKHSKEVLFEDDSKKRRDTRNNLYQLYRIYLLTPVIRDYLRRLKTKYKSIFPADEITINTMVTKQMTMCLGAMFGLFAVTLIICKGSLPYIIIGIVGAYISFTMMINNSHKALERKLLDQLDEFITEVHANYNDTKDVPDSISRAIPTLPYEISLHAKKILNIVQSPEIDYEIEQYTSIAPNRFLLLMATICASITEYGDKKLESGRTLFVTNLTYLKEELNDERMRLEKESNAFRFKNAAVLMTLFILKPAENLLVGSVPELASFYNGSGGLISLSIIAAIVLIVYEVLNILKDANEDVEESKILKKIAEMPFVQEFLTKVINHKYTKSLQIGKLLKITGSKCSLNTFILKRYSTAVGLFLLVIAVSIFADVRSKNNVLTDFTSAYDNDLVPTAEYRAILRDASGDMDKIIKGKEDVDYMVQTYVNENNLDQTMTPYLITEMENRREEYKSYYFKWYVLLIGIAAAVIGYYIPLAMLKYRSKVLLLKRDDEVAQFRTVVLILMHEDGVLVDTILRWMKKFAVVFRSSINECIMNFEYSQEAALRKLRDVEGDFPPFKRLCTSLLSADKTGIAEAFDDLETDRAYYHDKRKELTEENLRRASSTSSMLIMIPIGAAIALYIILPFGVYVIKMLMDMGAMF